MSTLRRGLLSSLLVLSFVCGGVEAQEDNELDRFMAQVRGAESRNVAARLEYVLDERAEVRFTGPDRDTLFRGDFTWYAREGVFVRSPIRIDGVPIGEGDRRTYEARWLERAHERQRARTAASETDGNGADAETDDLMMHWMLGGFGADTAQVASGPGDEVADPSFVADAYALLDGLLESGTYYLVGSEVWDGHEVLRIEYYRERLASRPGKGGQPTGDAEIGTEWSKTMLLTLWVDPVQRQIVRYSLDNLGLGFLPGRWVLRLDDVTASMSMRQPFAGVWMPGQIEMRAVMRLATGTYELRSARTFSNYREAVTGGRLLGASEER